MGNGCKIKIYDVVDLFLNVNLSKGRKYNITYD